MKLYKNNALNQIIWINIFIFLTLIILSILDFIDPEDTESFNFLAASTNIDIMLQNPWTLLTQMFTHIGVIHIFGNMLLLYIFGNIFLKYLNNIQFISTYLLGGICSFICLIIFDDLKEWNIGASGATYSIMFATTFFIPNYSFKIYNTDLLIKIKYLTIFIIITPIIVDLILDNQGFQTHITHIGGGCYGLLYIYLLKLKKRNMFKKIISFFYSLSKSEKKEKRNENDYDYNTRKKNEDYKLNQVLDKISKSGYSSLTKKEKKILEKYN